MPNTKLENIYKWAWIVLIILAVYLAVQTIGSLKNLRNTDPAYNSITVSGEGESFAVPDLASFTFTVSADASTVSTAQEQVTKKIDAILAALEDQGIEEKDIKTSDYSVWPKYTYTNMPCTPSYCPPSKQIPDGYTAQHSVMVKVRKTEDAGKALAIAGEQGATNLSGISFTVDDPDKVTEEARALAIKDAKAKAEILSDELGVRLVKVVSFTDSTDGNVPMPYYTMDARGGAEVSQAKAPTIPTGENKVRVTVQITYEIR